MRQMVKRKVQFVKKTCGFITENNFDDNYESLSLSFCR